MTHTKGLEGAESGADLQIAVQLSNGRWASLLLQAKRLYPNGKYRYWKASQVAALCKWAEEMQHIPALLLYNGPYGDYRIDRPAAIEFGRCAIHATKQSRCGLSGCESCVPSLPCQSFPNHSGSIGLSPLGITILPLNAHYAIAQVGFRQSGQPQDFDAREVASLSMPWECLDCLNGRRVTPMPNERQEYPYVSTFPEIPPWAAALEAATASPAIALDRSFDFLTNSHGELPRYSVVIRPDEYQ